jgi:hypothetical protein
VSGLFYFDDSLHDGQQGIGDPQKTVFVGDSRVVAFDGLEGKEDAPVKLACFDFHIMIAASAIGRGKGPGAGNSDVFIGGGDANGFLFHAGEFDYDNPLLISLIHVTLGMPYIVDGIFNGSGIMSERIYFAQYLEHFSADTQQIIIDFIVHGSAPVLAQQDESCCT